MATKETRIFITYFFPGSFFSEEIEKRVESPELPKTIPKDCFAFRFHQREYMIDGEDEFKGKVKPLSKTYVVGDAIPLDQIPDEVDGRDTMILKGNVRNNSPTQTAIRTHLGNWQMEDENHVAIPVSKFELGPPMYYRNP